ncbi:MAG: hypothetical protein ACTIA6_10995 [Pseudoclavibacter sp.]
MNSGIDVSEEGVPYKLPAIVHEIETQEIFQVRLKDWSRLRRSVASLKNPSRGLANAAWTFVGLGVSASFAGLAWWPAFESLGPEQRVQFVIVWPIIVSAFILGVLGVIAFSVANRLTSHSHMTSAQDLLELMDDIRSVK